MKYFLWFFSLSLMASFTGCAWSSQTNSNVLTNDNTNVNVSSTQEQQCIQSGGTWREFSNGCVDSCDNTAGNTICTQAFTYGCDCGVNQCWDFETSNCITNPSNTMDTVNEEVTRTNTADYITTSTGLQYKDTVVGSGALAMSGNKVTVHYTGTLADGTVFDSSYSRNKPFTFNLGLGEVIEGWDKGVAGMAVGGKRSLIIPADLGYGNQAIGSIPAGSTLYFDVEVLNLE